MTENNDSKIPEQDDLKIDVLAEKLVGEQTEKEEEAPVGLKQHRSFDSKTLTHIVTFISCLFALTYIYFAYFGYPNPQISRGAYLGFVLVLVFIYFPATKKSPLNKPTVLDWILVILSIYCTWFFVDVYEDLMFRGADVNVFEIAVSTIGILLCLEATRRVVGNFLPILALIFLLYAYFGPYVPGMLAHRGYSFERIVSFQWLTIYGSFGVVTAIFANFVFLFVILGTFLDRFGAAKFFIELPYALVGRSRGGPAKAAVLVSGFIGSISGSAVANVTTTGTFTIPLMKRTGYKPFVAAAVEAAASTGGQMVPPIMGAAAFLIAEFAGVPYATVVLVSIGPAILYFASVIWMVHLEAVQEGLKGLTKDQLPNVKDTLKKGWFYVIPFVIIFTLLIQGYSPGLSAFWALSSIFVIGMANPATRLNVSQIIDMLATAGRRSLLIGSMAGSIGLLIGVVQLTGLGLTASDFIVELSQGVLPLAIIMVGIASYLLGMGLTVTSSYVILAVLAVPALTAPEMGVPVLAAHLIVFWFSQDANVTPPVCLAAYAGAGIAGANPMQTGWQSFMFARGLYVIPFMYAYMPSFMLETPLWDILLNYAYVGIGMFALGSFFKGYLITKMAWWERFVALAAAFLLWTPAHYLDLIGIGLLVLLIVYEKKITQPRELQASAEVETKSSITN